MIRKYSVQYCYIIRFKFTIFKDGGDVLLMNTNINDAEAGSNSIYFGNVGDISFMDVNVDQSRSKSSSIYLMNGNDITLQDADFDDNPCCFNN